MQAKAEVLRPWITCGVAARARSGSDISGDLHLVQPIPRGALLAVIDGLGHGHDAAAAAQTAKALLERYAEEPLASLVNRCHAALRKTRGVAMTVAKLDLFDGDLAWLGIGDVQAVLIRPGRAESHVERLVLRNGLVGYEIPNLQPNKLPLEASDSLIFATDGIRAGFTQDWRRHLDPQTLADRILERRFKGTDDALVLVVHYLGQGNA